MIVVLLDAVPATSDGSAILPTSQTRARGTFRREGEYWTVGLENRLTRVRDCLGLRYLAELLRHPNQAIPAIDVAMVARGCAASHESPALHGDKGERMRDAGDVLDFQARLAYRRRLTLLREHLAEALCLNDGRASGIEAEIQALEDELASAIGLGGRARRASSAMERARVNVTRSVHEAIRRIAALEPELGRHLTTTIKTGNCCSYDTDPTGAIVWTF